ncbi:MAG: UDP-3-O-(3-hydroxymyristoyl)glucosamine N-acyltransferase [Candidatus Sumerlaeota bacterium]|nr:UDP-3-O-(3-hydroxymyristoyl)glucosamine N-acyltransferase [Candidatus Sumerlaeota bacterium]
MKTNRLDVAPAEPRAFRLGELAERLDATLERADPAQPVGGFATLTSAGPSDLSFIASARGAAEARESRAGAFLAPEGLATPERPTLRVKEIWSAVNRLIELFRPQPPVAEGIHPTAAVAESAQLGDGLSLGAHVAIGERAVVGEGTVVGAGSTIGAEARIGRHCLLYPGVHVYHRVTIGDRCILHSGAVIGSDGFRFELVGGRLMKIRQVGVVVIEDDVEIGANCAIDRAFLDETRIGAGTKLDNLVHIAHNVTIGRGCRLTGQVGIAGSATLGDDCVVAGQSGVKDNTRVGRGVQIGAKSAVLSNVPDGAAVIGIPAIDGKEWTHVAASLRRLPRLLKRVAQLEKEQDRQ